MTRKAWAIISSVSSSLHQSFARVNLGLGFISVMLKTRHKDSNYINMDNLLARHSV